MSKSKIALRAVSAIVHRALSKPPIDGTTIVVMNTHARACETFAEILEILKPYEEHIPLIASYPTRTIRLGGRVVKVTSATDMERSVRGIELTNYWLDGAKPNPLTPEQIGLLESRVRK